MYAGSGPLVDASVSCHPAFLAIPEDIEKVEKPLSIHIGDSDDYVPLSECEKIQEVFKHKPNCSINVYKDQVHGFAARGDRMAEKDRTAKEEVAEKVTRSMILPNYIDHRIFQEVFGLVL
jgi:dienelactone hydrolase